MTIREFKRATTKHRCVLQLQSQCNLRTCQRASARHLAKEQVQDILQTCKSKSESIEARKITIVSQTSCRLAKATAMHTANSQKAIVMNPPVANVTATILVCCNDGNQSKKSSFEQNSTISRLLAIVAATRQKSVCTNLS